MENHVTLQVARYRPEQQSDITFDQYEVPCPKEWVVLDGLNHIKDRLDGTLSYRWSCRMGICGSCGMTINGEPKLTCATFLADYAPGPIRVEPLRNFPVIRDLVVDIGDFMRKLTRVKPWIVRRAEKPLSEGEYRQTPQELDEYKQFSMCINCMLCYAACPIYGLDPKFIGPAAIALAQDITSTPATTAPRSGWRCSRSTRGSGAARSSGSAHGCAPRTSIQPERSSATSSPLPWSR